MSQTHRNVLENGDCVGVAVQTAVEVVSPVALVALGHRKGSGIDVYANSPNAYKSLDAAYPNDVLTGPSFAFRLDSTTAGEPL